MLGWISRCSLSKWLDHCFTVLFEAQFYHYNNRAWKSNSLSIGFVLAVALTQSDFPK